MFLQSVINRSAINTDCLTCFSSWAKFSLLVDLIKTDFMASIGCIKSFCSNLSKISWIRRSQGCKVLLIREFFWFTKLVRLTTTKLLWRFPIPWQFWLSNLQGLSLCYCVFIECIKSIILSLTLIESSRCIHSWNCFLDSSVFCL